MPSEVEMIFREVWMKSGLPLDALDGADSGRVVSLQQVQTWLWAMAQAVEEVLTPEQRLGFWEEVFSDPDFASIARIFTSLGLWSEQR